MNPMLFFISCLVFLLIFLYAEKIHSSLGIWIGKSGASLSFVMAGYTYNALASTYGQMLFIALILCLLGDILLIPNDKKVFILGIFSFLVAHLAFVLAFLKLDVELNMNWFFATLFIEAFIATAVLRYLWHHLTPEFKVPVLAYITIICAMVAVAAGVSGAGAKSGILLAAIMFFLSDLAVARQRFVKAEFINKLIGLPLYYGAVLLFITTLS